MYVSVVNVHKMYVSIVIMNEMYVRIVIINKSPYRRHEFYFVSRLKRMAMGC